MGGRRFLFAAVLVLIASACGDDSSSETAPTTSPPTTIEPDSTSTAAVTTTEVATTSSTRSALPDHLAELVTMCHEHTTLACDEFFQHFMALVLGVHPDPPDSGAMTAAMLGLCGDHVAGACKLVTAALADDPSLLAATVACALGDAGSCAAAAAGEPPATPPVVPGVDVGSIVVAPPAIPGEPAGDGPHTYGDDPVLDALVDSCLLGNWLDCDQLFLMAPIGSNYEILGMSCSSLVVGQFGCQNQMQGSDLVIDPGFDAPVPLGGLPARILSFTAGQETVNAPGTVTLSWTTENAACGAYLDGVRHLENASATVTVPAGSPATITYTLTAWDATCSPATQALSQVTIAVIDTTTTTLSATAVHASGGPVDLWSIDWFDLDSGTKTSNGPATDLLWTSGCSDADWRAIAETTGDGSSCYTLSSPASNGGLAYAGSGTYDDCLNRLPSGILSLDTIAGQAIPNSADGLVAVICYRTGEDRPGVLRAARVPSGALCWGDLCATTWEVRIAFTTWES